MPGNVEGRVFRAEKSAEDVPGAIHAAFTAFEVEFEHQHRRRRRVTKGTGARLEGGIKRSFRGSGYGFIRHQPGRDVSFHKAALHDLQFDGLEPGDPVEFEIESGERGSQDSQVHSAGAHSRI